MIKFSENGSKKESPTALTAEESPELEDANEALDDTAIANEQNEETVETPLKRKKSKANRRKTRSKSKTAIGRSKSTAGVYTEETGGSNAKAGVVGRATKSESILAIPAKQELPKDPAEAPIPLKDCENFRQYLEQCGLQDVFTELYHKLYDLKGSNRPENPIEFCENELMKQIRHHPQKDEVKVEIQELRKKREILRHKHAELRMQLILRNKKRQEEMGPESEPEKLKLGTEDTKVTKSILKLKGVKSKTKKSKPKKLD